MNFCKTFPRPKRNLDGSLIIKDGKLFVTINHSNLGFKEIGVLEDKSGIGAVMEKDGKSHKTPFIKRIVVYDKEDIPSELQAKEYKFRIFAEKISDTEFVFPFKAAKMMNKK